PTIVARLTRQANQAALTIRVQPALQGAQAEFVFACQLCQGHAIFHARAQNTETFECTDPVRLLQLAEQRRPAEFRWRRVARLDSAGVTVEWLSPALARSWHHETETTRPARTTSSNLPDIRHIACRVTRQIACRSASAVWIDE